MIVLTQAEKVIFKEREIDGLKRDLEKWENYASGKIDIHQEFRHILESSCRNVLAVTNIVTGAVEDRDSWLKREIWDYYDRNYYDYKSEEDCKRDFLSRYPWIYLTASLDEYNQKIYRHNEESAKGMVRFLEQKITKETENLVAMKNDLKPHQVLELAVIERNPYARVHSPSFMMTYCGQGIAEAFASGFAGCGAEGEV